MVWVGLTEEHQRGKKNNNQAQDEKMENWLCFEFINYLLLRNAYS